jgi:hypothetical protein
MGLSTLITWGACIVVFIVMVLIRAGEIGADKRKGHLVERKGADGEAGPL